MKKLVEKACKYLSVLKDFDLEEFEIESAEAKLRFSTQSAAAPAVMPAAPAAPANAPMAHDASPSDMDDEGRDGSDIDEEAYATIASPIVGTFYRKPAPDKPPYIEVGQNVDPDQPVCIVEAMKLMNEIKSHIHGRVVKILVEDAEPVQAGQVLFLIEPV